MAVKPTGDIMGNQYAELGTLVLALAALWLLFALIPDPIALLTHSIFAFAVLLLLNMIFKLGIPVNIITILIVAIGGVIGLFLIILLRFSKIAFHDE